MEDNMAKKIFVWLLDSAYPRKGALVLEKGKEYDAASFPEHVVDEWVRTGAAKYASEKSERKINIGD